MKEVQQATLTRAEGTASWKWQIEQLPESAPLRDAVPSVDGIQAETSEIVLLFLDLARTTGDAAYLEVAKAGARHLTRTWENLVTNPAVINAVFNPSLANNLSRTAFALAEAWKATKNPVYRDAGLNIIRYIAGIESIAGRELGAIHRGERR